MSDPRWLDEREARAWRGFANMQARLSAELNRRLVRDAGLSITDYAVLVHLSEAPEGQLRPYELAAMLQWEKSRLSHHLTRMEKRGLVAKVACPSDARGAFVVITGEGRAAIEAAAPQHVEDVRRYLVDALTDDQLDALAEISEAVLAGLGASDPACD